VQASAIEGRQRQLHFTMEVESIRPISGTNVQRVMRRAGQMRKDRRVQGEGGLPWIIISTVPVRRYPTFLTRMQRRSLAPHEVFHPSFPPTQPTELSSRGRALL